MDSQEIRFYASLLKLIDGDLEKEEAESLDAILKSSENARQRYCEFMEEYLLARDVISEISIDEVPSKNRVFDKEMWNELAHYEKSAPELEIEKPKPQPIPPQISEVMPASGRKKNKVSFALIAASFAAMLFFLGYIQFLPLKSTRSCAVLVDSVDAKWKNGTEEVQKGGFLYNYKDAYELISGTVKIRFDYGGEVIAEGPSVFYCQTPESLLLQSGRIHIYVPSQMAGFTVDTPSSKIIDLGTRFGVYVKDGSTDVYMLQGKAAIIPGLKGRKGAVLNIEEGQAAHVDRAGHIESIQFEKNQFVQQISSANKSVWRGEEVETVEGLIIHLKADSLDLSDGDPVAFWPDSAVNDTIDGTVKQVPGMGLPVFKSNAYNGMPAVRFTRPKAPASAPDSLKQVLASRNWKWDRLQGVTIFIVCTGGIRGNVQRAVQVGKSDGETYKSFGCDVCSDKSGTRDNNGWCLADSPFKYGQWHMSVRQIAQQGPYDSVFYSVNNTEPLDMKSNQAGRNIKFDSAGNDISIGNGRLFTGNWAPQDWYDGYVAEVLVYNKQLTMTEKQSVLNYLFAKYGYTDGQFAEGIGKMKKSLE